MRSLFAALPLLVAATVPAAAQETRPEQTAASPDGSIVLTVSTDNDQRPIWSLSRKGKLLIASSKLGFLLTDGIALQRGFAIESAERASGDTRWEQPWGRSEEHTSELQSLMRISYAVFCLKKKNIDHHQQHTA